MAMAANAPVLPGTPVPIVPEVRRFEVPDMTGKGMWIMQRLLATFPHLSQQQLYGWLGGLIYSPEYLFLHQSRSVGLAQLVSTFTLTPRPVVEVRFVFVADKEAHTDQEQGAEFYPEFLRWGRNKNADTIVFDDMMSDVPEELIRKKVGRLLTRQLSFAKV
jgi:hypothetical protein